jgi:hypothetical protein
MPVFNRYGNVGSLPLQEMKLSTAHNPFVINKKAMWNGGDGMDYHLIQGRILS